MNQVKEFFKEISEILKKEPGTCYEIKISNEKGIKSSVYFDKSLVEKDEDNQGLESSLVLIRSSINSIENRFINNSKKLKDNE